MVSFFLLYLQSNQYKMKHITAKQLLENLVGKRFNVETLKAQIKKDFNVDVDIDDISRIDDELVDFNLIFNIDNPDEDLFVDVDVYFLPMRRAGFDDAIFYVTEVGYEFGK